MLKLQRTGATPCRHYRDLRSIPMRPRRHAYAPQMHRRSRSLPPLVHWQEAAIVDRHRRGLCPRTVCGAQIRRARSPMARSHRRARAGACGRSAFRSVRVKSRCCSAFRFDGRSRTPRPRCRSSYRARGRAMPRGIRRGRVPATAAPTQATTSHSHSTSGSAIHIEPVSETARRDRTCLRHRRFLAGPLHAVATHSVLSTVHAEARRRWPKAR